MTKRKNGKLRLGIYGGTFDPIHLGHLIIARDVLEQSNLDLILFVPCGQSPHKMDRESASARDRWNMLQRAIKNEPKFWASRIEIERKGPSYAVDTVEQIAGQFPAAELFWILGADQVGKLHTWERFSELKKKVKFIVAARPGEKAKKRKGLIYLPRPRFLDISATEIRTRVQHQLPIHHLVPRSVSEYIAGKELYCSCR